MDMFTPAPELPVNTILIIDDDAEVCVRIGNALGGDYQVHFLDSADRALRCVECVRPSVILCDGSLPVVSGYELAAALGRIPETASIPVIVMDGWNDGSGEERARRFGAVGFLPKPFLLSELQFIVARQAAQWSLAV